jgi:phage shock protein E
MKSKHTVIIKHILAAFVAFLTLCSCAHQKVDKDTAVWIDVRTPVEYQSGHLENATNIPHTEIVKRISVVVTDKDREINLYCGSGGRAEIARKALADLGCTHVTNAGGYSDLAGKNKNNEGQSKN